MDPQRETKGIDEYLGFQRRIWKFQRFGWAALAVFLLGDLLGLLGEGPLARGTLTGEGIEVEYPRLSRMENPHLLRLRVKPATSEGHVVRIWISQEIVAANGIIRIVPHPRAMRAAGDRQILEISVMPGGNPVHIECELKPNRMGLVTGEIGLVDGEPLSWKQFVFP